MMMQELEWHSFPVDLVRGLEGHEVHAVAAVIVESGLQARFLEAAFVVLRVGQIQAPLQTSSA